MTHIHLYIYRCYKNEKTIVSFWTERNSIDGLEIAGLKFSEPGKGKSTPDQYAALSKKEIDRSLKMGFDADTPEKMGNCIKKFGLSNVVIMLGGTKKVDISLEKDQLPNAGMYHDFEFREDGIIARRQSQIGVGVFFPLKPYSKVPSFDGEIINKEQLEDYQPTKCTTVPYTLASKVDTLKENEPDNDGVNDEEIDGLKNDCVVENGESVVWSCPNPRCSLQFLRKSNFDRHQNQHSKCKELNKRPTVKEYVTERVISKYGISSNKVPEDVRQKRRLVTYMGDLAPATMLNDEKELLLEGNALHVKKTAKYLNEKQKNYLQSLFDDGIASGKKARPHEVEKNMRRQLDEQGHLLFTYKEWLKESRIKTHFSNLAAKKKKKGVTKKKQGCLSFLGSQKNKTQIEVTQEDIEEAAEEMDVENDCENQINIINALENDANMIQLDKCPLQV